MFLIPNQLFRVDVQQNLSDCIAKNLTGTEEYQNVLDRNEELLKLYTIAVACSTILLIIGANLHFNFSCKASVNLHNAMTSSIVNAKMSFFDSHYFGNIINRFSKDLTTLDEYIPFITYDCIRVRNNF